MMTDYTALTDDALNREIAIRRGWTIEKCDTPAKLPEYQFWRVNAPDDYGDCGHARVATLLDGTEADAWKRFFTEDEPESAWVTDLNAAAELLKEMREHWLIFAGKQWQVNGYQGVDARGVSTHSNPARAICEAWLRFKDAAAS